MRIHAIASEAHGQSAWRGIGFQAVRTKSADGFKPWQTKGNACASEESTTGNVHVGDGGGGFDDRISDQCRKTTQLCYASLERSQDTGSRNIAYGVRLTSLPIEKVNCRGCFPRCVGHSSTIPVRDRQPRSLLELWNSQPRRFGQ